MTSSRCDAIVHEKRGRPVQSPSGSRQFSTVRFDGDSERAATVYEGLTPLSAEDVADAILWAVSRPEHVNIARVLLTPVQQANSLLFHREA